MGLMARSEGVHIAVTMVLKNICKNDIVDIKSTLLSHDIVK